MAKNYTFKEAVEIINKGTDLEAIAEIGKRFPILMLKTSKVCALAGEDFVDLMSYLPEHVTANKINSVIKGSVVDVEEDVDGVEEAEEGTEEKATAKAEKDYSEMNNKELKAALRKAGFKSAEIKGKNKAAMLEMLKNGAPVAEEVEDEEDEDEVTGNGNPYEGKSAMELFKECKKRGIKAAPKKPAKFYVDLLMKADAEAEEEEAEDDWEEEETPAPKAKKEKKEAKPAKKEVEEDDDWDI